MTVSIQTHASGVERLSRRLSIVAVVWTSASSALHTAKLDQQSLSIQLISEMKVAVTRYFHDCRSNLAYATTPMLCIQHSYRNDQ